MKQPRSISTYMEWLVKIPLDPMNRTKKEEKLLNELFKICRRFTFTWGNFGNEQHTEDYRELPCGPLDCLGCIARIIMRAKKGGTSAKKKVKEIQELKSFLVHKPGLRKAGAKFRGDRD